MPVLANPDITHPRWANPSRCRRTQPHTSVLLGARVRPALPIRKFAAPMLGRTECRWSQMLLNPAAAAEVAGAAVDAGYCVARTQVESHLTLAKPRFTLPTLPKAKALPIPRCCSSAMAASMIWIEHGLGRWGR